MVHSLLLTQSLFTLLSVVSSTSIVPRDTTTDPNQPINPQNSPFAFDPGFDIVKVVDKSRTLPTRSWEFGTESEALLELYNPELSVYGPDPFGTKQQTFKPEDIKALVYAKEKIVIGTGKPDLSDGDGAIGDPASLGIFAYMLGKADKKFAAAAQSQAQYIYERAPRENKAERRWWNGAISHRVEQPELWADFVYMAPPYLAYWGVVEKNITTLQEAVEQCILYRQILRVNTLDVPFGPSIPSTHPKYATGLWAHIIAPNWGDNGLWSTGNAWAAAGMMRVLATVLKAPNDLPWTTSFTKDSATKALSFMIREILDGAINSPRDPANNLLRNYLDNPDWWGEISGSSLLASVAYRMVTFAKEVGLGAKEISRYAAFAEDIRKTIADPKGNHVAQDGIISPAVNPLNWQDEKPYTQGSPEGNSFVVLLYAAYRDCVAAGVKGCEKKA